MNLFYIPIIAELVKIECLFQNNFIYFKKKDLVFFFSLGWKNYRERKRDIERYTIVLPTPQKATMVGAGLVQSLDSGDSSKSPTCTWVICC